MSSVIVWLAVGAISAGTVLLIGFLASSIRENETRATRYSLGALLLAAASIASIVLLDRGGLVEDGLALALLAGGLSVSFVVFVVSFVVPIGTNPRAHQGTAGYIVGEVERYDERAHVFARNRGMRPGSEEFEFFYDTHPEFKRFDNRRRSQGGAIGEPGLIDKPYEGPNVAATLAALSFPHDLSTPDKVRPKPHPHLAGRRIVMTAAEATERAKGFTKSLGADIVGVARIHPNWVYSHTGEIFNENWEDWGQEIRVEHEYAVVFGVEMALDMLGPAPHTPATVESMHKYADGAFIATGVARYLANMGYSATAHHLRHYEVMLVPLAVDAGLGELSRMGYLISKEFGPRMRLGAVTTNLSLVPDKPVDLGVDDFCLACKKCAEACPPRAIPMEEKTVVNGPLRWKIDDQKCFGYWGRTGTDCSICMRVCPWSHARTLPHRLIVNSVARNRLARRIVHRMDDVFYGKMPTEKSPPDWAAFSGTASRYGGDI